MMRIYGIPIYRNHYVSNNVKHENLACLLLVFCEMLGGLLVNARMMVDTACFPVALLPLFYLEIWA